MMSRTRMYVDPTEILTGQGRKIILLVTSRITIEWGYMVCNMVCLVHLMHGHKTRTGTVIYSNTVYHRVCNALNF